MQAKLLNEGPRILELTTLKTIQKHESDENVFDLLWRVRNAGVLEPLDLGV